MFSIMKAVQRYFVKAKKMTLMFDIKAILASVWTLLDLVTVYMVSNRHIKVNPWETATINQKKSLLVSCCSGTNLNFISSISLFLIKFLVCSLALVVKLPATCWRIYYDNLGLVKWDLVSLATLLVLILGCYASFSRSGKLCCRWMHLFDFSVEVHPEI